MKILLILIGIEIVLFLLHSFFDSLTWLIGDNRNAFMIKGIQFYHFVKYFIESIRTLLFFCMWIEILAILCYGIYLLNGVA